MTIDELKNMISKYNPCKEGVDYLNTKTTLQEAWDNADHPQWMLWLAVWMGYDLSWLKHEKIKDVDYWMDVYEKTPYSDRKVGCICTILEEDKIDTKLCNTIRSKIDITNPPALIPDEFNIWI